MIIQAHIFDTEEECQAAIDLINESLGLPNQHHDSHSHPQFNNEKWFIQEDQDSIAVLGDGVEFEIVQPSFGEFV
jgi:hypothetical protein